MRQSISIPFSLIFNSSKINIKLIIIIFISSFASIKSLENFKAIYLSGNYYYMITSQKITYYLLDDNGGTNSLIVGLVNDEIISTSQEVEMITFGKFRDNDGVANLLIVKHYVYAILNNNYFCHVKLNEIVGFPPEVTAIKCMNNFCYYVVGIINYNKELKLFLYKNPSYNCKGYCAHTSTINGIGSNNFNCHLMKSYSNEDILVCFYQKQDSNQLTADRLTIFIDDNSCSTTSSETNPKELSYGIKIIKSSLSQDYKQAFVCFIDSNNDCKCLIKLNLSYLLTI